MTISVLLRHLSEEDPVALQKCEMCRVLPQSHPARCVAVEQVGEWAARSESVTCSVSDTISNFIFLTAGFWAQCSVQELLSLHSKRLIWAGYKHRLCSAEGQFSTSFSWSLKHGQFCKSPARQPIDGMNPSRHLNGLEENFLEWGSSLCANAGLSPWCLFSASC